MLFLCCRTLSSETFLGVPSLLNTLFKLFGLLYGPLLASLSTEYYTWLGHWVAVLIVVYLAWPGSWVHNKSGGALVFDGVICSVYSKLEIWIHSLNEINNNISVKCYRGTQRWCSNSLDCLLDKSKQGRLKWQRSQSQTISQISMLLDRKSTCKRLLDNLPLKGYL